MTNKFAPTTDERAFADYVMNQGKKTATPETRQELASEQELAFARQASEREPLPQETPWYKSYPSSLAKGLIEGIINVGRMMGPLQESRYGQVAAAKSEREAFLSKYLPSEEGYVESALSRTGELAPSVVAFPGAPGILETILRSGAAGASGAAAKQLGAGELGQSLAELPAMIVPRMGGKIIPTKAQQETVTQARKLGIPEGSIAPLIQSEKKVDFLRKFTEKRGRTQKVLTQTREDIGNVYKQLATRPEAQMQLSKEATTEVVNGIQDELHKMPYAIREKINPDLKEMLSKPITGEALMNFYHDLNYHISKGERQLGILKEPITQTLSKIDPQFGADFAITNNLYGKYAKITNKLKPTVASDIIGGIIFPVEIGTTLFGLITGNYPVLLETIGAVGARKLATESLINPRFQNLSKQMISALNQNKGIVAQKLLDSMIKQIKDIDPETAVELQKIDFSNFREQPPHQK